MKPVIWIEQNTNEYNKIPNENYSGFKPYGNIDLKWKNILFLHKK